MIPSDPLVQIAWRDCLMWAAGEADIKASFTRETGFSLPAKLTPLDMMIDSATGYDDALARKFIEWFNANVWGEKNP